MATTSDDSLDPAADVPVWSRGGGSNGARERVSEGSAGEENEGSWRPASWASWVEEDFCALRLWVFPPFFLLEVFFFFGMA